MKSNITISVDSEIIEKIRELNLNISGLCQDALQEAINKYNVQRKEEMAKEENIYGDLPKSIMYKEHEYTIKQLIEEAKGYYLKNSHYLLNSIKNILMQGGLTDEQINIVMNIAEKEASQEKDNIESGEINIQK